MSDVESFSIDFVRELRLRKWARQHWVAPEARKPTWHPIVLDEMALRDRERKEEILHESLARPAEVLQETTNVDGNRDISNDFVPDLHGSEARAFTQPIGSMYVPLAPTANWELHDGSTEIPKPHYNRVKSDTREYSTYRSW